MPQGKPKSGERYLHFKNKLYQIVTVAKHTETEETLVIYQALYGDFGIYARPLDLFISEVDHGKYPQVTQKYRFELVEESVGQEQTAAPLQEPMAAGQDVEEPVPQQEEVKVKGAEGLLMDFYDAKSYEEKYRILLDMGENISDLMIDNMAITLDVVIPEGETSIRLEELKRCIRTHRRYEIMRK